MKPRRKPAIGLLMALLLGLGMFTPGAAGAHTHPTPLLGSVTFSGPTPLPSTTNCPVSHHQSDGVGHATHLGQYLVTSTTCGFNPRVVTDPPFDPGGEPPYFVADFVNGQIWTMANGDQVFVSSFGVIVRSVADQIAGTRGGIVIEGGTGGFARATGAATAAGGGGGGGGGGFEFDGYISYRADDRSAG